MMPMMEPKTDPIVPKPNATSIALASFTIFRTSSRKSNDFWFQIDKITEAGKIRLHEALDSREFRANEPWLIEAKALLNAKLFKLASRRKTLKRPFELALEATGMKRPIDDVLELDTDDIDAILVARLAMPPLTTEDEARDEKGIRIARCVVYLLSLSGIHDF
jgi:hypothetical protein